MLKDPYIILGLERQKVTDEAVRKAYLNAIRACPPENDAAAFKRIQSAYATIKTKRQRMEHELFNYQFPSAEDIIAQAAYSTTEPPGRPSLASIQALLRYTLK